MNLQLINLIKSREDVLRVAFEGNGGNPEDWIPPTDAVLYADLAAKIFPHTDPATYTRTSLVANYPSLGPVVISTLEAVPAENPLKSVADTMLARLDGDGLSLADQETQVLFTYLGGLGVCTPEQATAIKEIGIRNLSWLDIDGLAETTLEEVTEARADRVKLATLVDALRSSWNDCIHLAEEGTLTAEIWAAKSAAVAAAITDLNS